MSAFHVRRDLRPGDVGALTTLHSRIYGSEHGLDLTFEASVAAGMAEMVARGWPGPGEGWWAVDDERGELAGSLALTDEGDGLARVRFFVLNPAARGLGHGRRMLDELLAEARAHGYERIELVTFSALEVAANAYRNRGFAVVSAQREPRWGRTLVLQHYEMEFTPEPSPAR